MKACLLFLGVALLAFAPVNAQDKVAPEPPAVVQPTPVEAIPELDDSPHKAEVLRRGDTAVSTGEFGDDIEAEPLKVFETPPDDSHKWYFTVVSIHNCQPCEHLKKLIKEGKFAAWVDASDPDKSWSHYTVRYVDDPLQKDWFSKLKMEGGFPKLLIQPPRNGEFGPNETVVAIVHWEGAADKDLKRLSNRTRAALIRYTKDIEAKKRRKTVSANVPKGAEQSIDQSEGVEQGKTPSLPFKLPGNDSKTPPGGFPSDYPPPEKLTIDQIKQVAPEATPEFILDMLETEATDPEKVALKWQIEQRKNRKPEKFPGTGIDLAPNPDPSTLVDQRELLSKVKPTVGGLKDALESVTQVKTLIDTLKAKAEMLAVVGISAVFVLGLIAVKLTSKLMGMSNSMLTKEDFQAYLTEAEERASQGKPSA